MLVLAFPQVLSPLAKGLFHKAISESGTAALGLFTDQPNKEAQVSICGNFNYFFQIVLHIWNCSFQNIETRFFPCETKHTVIKDSISVANSTRLMMCCFSNTQISTKKKERRQGKRIKCKGIL